MAVSSLVAAGGGAVIRRQVTFTSSGTFTLPAGYDASQPLLVDIEICGGGGGGGGGGKHGTNQTGYGGGGGASGVAMLYKNVPLTANATITLGAGGTGGAGTASAGSTGSDGSSGGTSDVNSLYFAPGGGAGSYGGYTDLLISRRGYGVNSYGFYIPGGMMPGQQHTPGAGGGSGGTYSNDSGTTSATVNWGGSRGSKGWTGPRDFNARTTNTTWDLASNYHGQGINGVHATLGSDISNNTVPSSYSEIAVLQRGAGGNGGAAANAVTSGGGLSGTKTDGGRSGYSNSLSGTGSANGGTATDAGAGGGGGAGRGSTGGTSGTGGNGGTGYAIITYWA